jgi:hypothetical protein
MKELNLMQLALEVVIGRLVLDLPKDDLKKINEMILRNLENAKVQE